MLTHRTPTSLFVRMLPECLRVLALFGLLFAVAAVLAAAPGVKTAPAASQRAAVAHAPMLAQNTPLPCAKPAAGAVAHCTQ